MKNAFERFHLLPPPHRMFSRHNVAVLAFVVLLVTAFAAFKACQPSGSLEFKSLADAKVFLELKGLHCRLTKDGLNVSMIVMEKPFTMTIQEEDEFHIAVHQNRISGGLMLIKPASTYSKMQSLDSFRQWGNIYAIGDQQLIRNLERQFR